MTLQIPLAVRIVAPVLDADTPSVDRHITSKVHGLRVRSTAPGGFASATFTLDETLSLQLDELRHFARVYVYDTRSGEVVWEGRAESPGRHAGGNGESYNVTGIGPSSHLRDTKAPTVYIDQDMTHWWPSFASSGATTGLGPKPDAADVTELVSKWLIGQVVATSDRGNFLYRHLYFAGQVAGRVDYAHSASHVASDWENRCYALTSGGSFDIPRADTFGSNQSSSPRVSGTDFSSGRNLVQLTTIYTGGGATVGSFPAWGGFTDLVVMPEVYNSVGSAVAPSNNYLTADQVVWDLLYRLLTASFQVDEATVTASTYHIEQMAYIDGIDPAGVLDDLILLEPGFYWAVWESNIFTGRYRFEWVQWPSEVRYEASTVDGFDSPSPGDDVYDSVVVRWRGKDGQILTTTRTSTPTILTRPGISRGAFIDLGDEAGSQANAEQIGDEFLAQHATPHNAGTLTVARPIYDVNRGCVVDPWLIRPGFLIRVRGVESNVDALNASDRDGETVFRVRSVEYDSDSGAATLELDSYSASVARSLADLQARNLVRRR